MKLLELVFSSLLLLTSITVFAKEAILIKDGNSSHSLSLQEIQSNKNIEELKNIEIQAYPGKHFNLLTIKLCRLLNHVDKNEEVKITAKDKYFIYLSRSDLSGCGKSSGVAPYLAIQKNKNMWPKMHKSHEEVGTFSLIWLGSSSENISKEKWVRNISTLEIVNRKGETELIKSFHLKLNKNQDAGYRVFVDNCAGCHSLNLIGQLDIGPDLNYPMNPLEYFTKNVFKKFIRNPEAVRYFKNSKMEGFDMSAMSEEDLENLVSFMKLMIDHKIQRR